MQYWPSSTQVAHELYCWRARSMFLQAEVQTDPQCQLCDKLGHMAKHCPLPLP